MKLFHFQNCSEFSHLTTLGYVYSNIIIIIIIIIFISFI